VHYLTSYLGVEFEVLRTFDIRFFHAELKVLGNVTETKLLKDDVNFLKGG
jgi:hypothetical protein